ncbi:uncharacterized protein EHS24_000886 [Apiotrichum porosum]|uniref:Uncharacterized protein n=1 Tax=Apiotrichum porosum TaxID=105984 RepID=A0A427YB78_9TREE|nr:uncharacterized protein EHS24_000886 [Apiotrichum porosum]RSH88348.1 hypothetical protein EHS24_000886 [Apiotrichum porosum]
MRFNFNPHTISLYRQPYWCLGDRNDDFYNYGSPCIWTTPDDRTWICRYCDFIL